MNRLCMNNCEFEIKYDVFHYYKSSDCLFNFVPFGKVEVIKFDGSNRDLVDRYGISVSQMTTNMFHLW